MSYSDSVGRLEHAVVKGPEEINDHLGTPALVNMEEGDFGVGEYPEPVALPSRLVGVDERSVGQRILQRLVKRLPLLGEFIVEADDGSGRDVQPAQMLKGLAGVVVGCLDLVPEKGGFGSGFRSDEGFGNFTLAPAMNDIFAIGTPVVVMNKEGDGKPTFLKVLLNMAGGVVARGNAVARAVGTGVKIDVDGFVDMVGLRPVMSFMAERGSSLLGILGRFLSFIFLVRIFEGVGKFGLEIGVGLFKLLDPLLKFFHLGIGEVHGELKLVHPLAEIVPLSENAFRRFAPKKHAKLLERAVRTPDASLDMAWIFSTAHCRFPILEAFETTKRGNPPNGVAVGAIMGGCLL
jgi:hypothetical protein